MKAADAPGVYHLLLRVPRSMGLRVGKLGVFAFPAGYYAYTGSAMRGLRARLDRHRRRRKKLWWHIDYLLRRAQIVEVVEVPTRRRMECALNRRVLATAGARVVARGFGSSDCSCATHLVYLGEERRGLALLEGPPGR